MPAPRLDRRTFLRSSGIAIGLPFLEAMIPASANEAKKALNRPPRMVLVGQPLGMYGPNFFPEHAGKDCPTSAQTEALDQRKKRLRGMLSCQESS